MAPLLSLARNDSFLPDSHHHLLLAGGVQPVPGVQRDDCDERVHAAVHVRAGSRPERSGPGVHGAVRKDGRGVDDGTAPQRTAWCNLPHHTAPCVALVVTIEIICDQRRVRMLRKHWMAS